MNPEELLSTEEHPWVEIEGQEARFGVTGQVLEVSAALRDGDRILIAGFP